MGEREELVLARLAKEAEQRRKAQQECDATLAQELINLRENLDRLTATIHAACERVVQQYENTSWSAAQIKMWPIEVTMPQRIWRRTRVVTTNVSMAYFDIVDYDRPSRIGITLRSDNEFFVFDRKQTYTPLAKHIGATRNRSNDTIAEVSQLLSLAQDVARLLKNQARWLR